MSTKTKCVAGLRKWGVVGNSPIICVEFHGVGRGVDVEKGRKHSYSDRILQCVIFFRAMIFLLTWIDRCAKIYKLK